MVDGQWILLGYLVLLVVTVVALLCGDWPIFEGTPVQSFHHCLTGGAFAYFEKVVEFLCGERGRRSLSSLEHYCCERPNPILQLFYISIIGGIYYAIVQSSFEYIPGYFVPSIHRYIGTFAVGIGIILFLMTSFSDPGTVTAENVSFQLSAYAYDGVLYEEKVCSTCNLPRPARSKHCGICGRCVARFDHHCAWMNNCVGWNNLRYFLAFLLWHCLLCIYGASVLVAILAGQVKEQNIVRILTAYFGVANTFDKLMPHIFQWLLGYYNTQVFIILFLLVISLLLIGFLGYHVYLVATNTTTNESYKWENYRRWKFAEAARERELDEQRSGDAGGQLQKKRSFLPKCGGVFRLFRSHEQTQPALSRDNIYNRGFVNNAYEILFPWRNQGRSNPKEKKKRP